MAFNPDPFYSDPEIERLRRPRDGSIEAIDRFNAPPPGHSLTSEPQKWAWEKPPEYTVPEEAMAWVVSRIEQPEVEENFLRLMLGGVPIEAITNTITFTGFTEGYWTPDLSEILKMPISMHLMDLAIENNIPATVFNKDPEIEKEENRIPDKKVMAMMAANRPDMYNKIMYVTDLVLEEDKEMPEEQGAEDSPMQEDVSFMEMEEEEMI
jgi:hypothetical protein|tara:strand:- start:3921 stop:4547 length:627 start_codon:yes stop_codon:yes gene_type:complete